MALNTAAEAHGSGGLRDRIAAERYPFEIGEQVEARGAPRAGSATDAELLHAMAAASPDAVFITDADERITFVNAAGEKMFGFPLAELSGKRFRAVFHPTRPAAGAAPVPECPVGRTLTTGEPTRDYRGVFFRRNGSSVDVLLCSAAVMRNGVATACVAFVRDVTHEDSDRVAMKKTNERLASALATAEFGVWDMNFVTGEIYWDARIKSLLGLHPSRRITLELARSFVHPDDRCIEDAILRAGANGDRDFQWEWRVVLRDGSVRWHQGRGYFRRDEAGRVTGAHGVTRDITDQKEAQQVQERLAAIVRSTEYSIGSVDLDGNITHWNRGAEAMFGYRADEIVGRSAAILLPPDRAGEQEMFIAGVRRGETHDHFITERLTKSGRRIWVSISLSPMRDGRGCINGCGAVIRDITRERQLEEKLRQAEKMEAVGRLAGGVAHDFNNLLTVVIGCADLALRDTPNGWLREQIAAIKSAGQRAADLTHRLLAFGKEQVLQPQILDVNRVVSDLLPLLRRLIRANIECDVKLDPRLSRVKADPGQIEELLLNLVINSSDAIVSRGVISIETRNVVLDDEYVRTHPEATCGDHAVLAVHDNGAGIDPAIRPHIFEPFFTTKPEGKGTGLGLSVVYGIASQSGGHVTCDSDPGAGTTFAVYLPAVPAADTTPAPLQEALPAESVDGAETILLAEDNPLVRDCTARFLRSFGYTVLEASCGADAVSIAEKHRNAIDLLVTDVTMPDFGGPALVAAIRPTAPRMHVLYISGYTGRDFDGKGDAFLAKPFTPAQLAASVREVLRAPIPSVQNQLS